MFHFVFRANSVSNIPPLLNIVMYTDTTDMTTAPPVRYKLGAHSPVYIIICANIHDFNTSLVPSAVIFLICGVHLSTDSLCFVLDSSIQAVE